MGMGFGWIFWVVILIVAVAAIGIWMRRSGGSGGELPPTALEILKARYASGEIDKQTYDDMRKEID